MVREHSLAALTKGEANFSRSAPTARGGTCEKPQQNFGILMPLARYL